MTFRTNQNYHDFLRRVENEIMSHPIIHDNQYTRWFKEGAFTLDDLRHFTTQFSVFSNFFIIAQLKKVINAVSLEEMRASKEILANEIGVVFHKKDPNHHEREFAPDEAPNNPELVSSEGTVQGGLFHFEAAHFEWLLNFAKPLGLEFSDLGKRHHGTTTTLHFTDGLERIYGGIDFSRSAGASFAIENWAAAGFWKELIQGLKIFRQKTGMKLNLGFWTFHDRLEDQHAQHTKDELREVFFYQQFNEDKFVQAGREMLDCCAVFWNGLHEDQLKRQTEDRKAV